MAERMEVDAVLQELEELIQNAPRIPISGKVMADGDAILACIDKIYDVLPEELKQAKQVIEHSDKLLESMEMQGKRMIEDARNQAAMLVSETQILQDAQAQANVIIAEAEKNAVELRADSYAYSEDMLQQLELNLERVILAIKKSREDLKAYRNN
ncbi:MAG: hypothetical protein IJP33_06450 [Firmicutes bacterium]|nr:hypothetical protein [Bacillota bacterium]